MTGRSGSPIDRHVGASGMHLRYEWCGCQHGSVTTMDSCYQRIAIGDDGSQLLRLCAMLFEQDDSLATSNRGGRTPASGSTVSSTMRAALRRSALFQSACRTRTAPGDGRFESGTSSPCRSAAAAVTGPGSFST